MGSSQLSPPFSVEHQLNKELSEDHSCSARHLPGYPHIALDDPCRIWNFLNEEFCSKDLDKMADKLWWMSKQDSASISPLHRQRVKRRAIIVTEDPKLHLVWIHDRVFVKPLPRYILSHPFWQRFLSHDSSRDTQHHRRVREAILGYLRTYRYLVRYESDFYIAQEPGLQLIPSDVTWEQFCHFGADLMSIGDSDVSARYCYGEIRLTRLNFYAPILLRQSYFQRVEYQYGAYFARFYGPILFWLGIVSVVLSGLQVVVAIEEQSEGESRTLSVFALGFSIAIITSSWLLLILLASVLVYKVAKEWRFAIHDRMRILRERNKDNRLSP
ncbi:hypothetical protein PGQ11_008403 [Apiospora arundinis]|uniref:Uncharacterized protein n=1 Tax=Apiospora arundinis TaxID=335852 RepID=A0ABR2IFW3_9PEZI